MSLDSKQAARAYDDARSREPSDESEMDNDVTSDIAAAPLHAGASYQAGASVSTLASRSDDVLLKNLPDYIAAAQGNQTINGGLIEAAQASVTAMVDLATMDEDALEELDASSPLAQAAKAKAIAAKYAREASDRVEDLEKERQREEHRAQWDSQMHRIGDQEYSGAQLHAMHEWLNDEKNQETFEQELMEREGISKEEAKKRRMNAQEYLKMLEKERNGEQLTEEEKRKKRELEQQPGFSETMHTLSDKVIAPESQKYGYKVSSNETGQQKADVKESVASASQTTAKLGFDTEAVVAPPLSAAQTSAAFQNEDITAPLIKADPLRPAFQKADASTVPLEGTKRQPAPQLIAQNTVSAPQMEGATF